ncbi:UNVERIFIED_ORG: hypothetical protein GCAPEGMB_00447 [Vibrio phage V07]
MRADALGLFWQDMPTFKKKKEEEIFNLPPATWKCSSHLPYYDDAVNMTGISIMTEDEVIEAWQQKHLFTFDIESYINWCLIGFRNENTGKIIYWEKTATDYGDSDWNLPLPMLDWFVRNMHFVGFNSMEFDMTLAAMAIAGKSCAQMKAATNMMIQENYRGWQVLRKLRLKKIEANHIDIMEVAPNFGSLKIYNGRSGGKRMQDLPYEHDVELTPDQIVVTRYYWANDLDATATVMSKIQDEMKLREDMSEQYGVDLRSKSDAQIAEAVIAHELERLTGKRPQKPTIEPGTVYRYNAPAFLQFQTPLMKQTLEVVKNCLYVVSYKGGIETPAQLKGLKVTIGEMSYKLGIGGLHSTEKKATHISDENYQLSDHDVASYYPRIMLNNNYYPQHLGRPFLAVFDNIVETRLEAKHNGDSKTAQSLKIVINGTFGKLGSQYSLFYSPDLLIHVTLTGQLSLLLLIETFELNGIQVVSANTDGIVIKCHKSKFELREQILEWWQRVTAFELEATYYAALCSKDVNNYFAVKMPYEDKKTGKMKTDVKAKGIYAKPGLSKNPTTPICAEAVKAYVAHGTPIEQTISACKDPFMFSSVRKVTGGSVWCMYKTDFQNPNKDQMEEHIRKCGYIPYVGTLWVHKDEERPDKNAVRMDQAFEACKWNPVEYDYLGGAIRWYYGKPPENSKTVILQAEKGSKVPKTEGAYPMMTMLDELPENLDMDWYVNEAKRILKDIGHPSAE